MLDNNHDNEKWADSHSISWLVKWADTYRMTNDLMQKSDETKGKQQCKNTRNKLLLSISLAITAQLPEKRLIVEPQNCSHGNQRSPEMF